MDRRPERAPFRGIAPHRRAVAIAAWALTVIVAGTGCAASDTPPPTPTASAPSTLTPNPSESTTDPPAPTEPAGPTLDPEGSAEQNLAFFTGVVEEVWASPENVQGRAYVDALVAGGFDKAEMQVTPDTSTVGNPAESILFSVRWGDECLIGQVGPATGTPVTTVMPVLEGGACLVGRTRPIDW